MRLVCSVLVALVVVTAAAASSSLPVRVGEGIAGVRLGMTQAQVAARLGKPYGTTLPSGHATCGLYARVPDFGACFDTATRRVISLDGIGPKFCVVRPRFCFQRVGNVTALKRAFGRRLLGPVWNRDGDERFYEVIGRSGGRRVQTAFVVDTQSSPPYRGSAVTAVYIAYCGWQGKNVPAFSARR